MQYEIRALQNHKIVAFQLAANSDLLARKEAAAKGYLVLAVKPIKQHHYQLRSYRFPLVLFSQELHALLDAGLNLFESIEVLAEKEQQTETRQVLEGVLNILKEGKTISAAMEQFPRAFPPLYIATVKASERTGGIGDALKRFVSYQSQVEQLKKKVITATIYPALLIVVGGAVTLFLLGYVVPKFAFIYEDMGGDLPLLSRVLLQFGNLINHHGFAVLIVLILLITLFIIALTRQTSKLKITEWLWKIPAIGEHLRIYQLARFYRTVGMLLEGGNTISAALKMVTGLLSPALQTNLKLAATKISQGHAVSVAMEQHALTTPVTLRMLRVGERGGQMGRMMERAASFYDDEIARTIDWATRLFEPLLMLIIGLVIGLVVVLLYMPIFELAGSIQ